VPFDIQLPVSRRSSRSRIWKLEDSKLCAQRGMRTNGADNRGAAVVSWRSVLGVELGEPLNPSASSVQMVQCIRHDCMRLIVSRKQIWCGVEWCEALRSSQLLVIG